ncbi:HlyD family secretion protein [Aeoliella mucimassa]|uniref:Type I secretion system membrane fusion protein PrsE n=1 Tax=Aeoliella mucimassa TaxID=2527972 RepID=A0A518AS94_9BACT|nr:HlyD family efflux transporter periplasmic adaptor subunit [Aeoliella mucimassa]QDU57595.1 Type I secretion system membrane fusion protein PrsE [Aeoliella mucimassa]
MSTLANKVAKKRVFSDAAYDEQAFPALRLARAARFVRRLGRVLLTMMFILMGVMLLAPWQQSIRGNGEVIAFDPFERPQPVQAPIKGRIAERGEGVQENAYVTKGQLLFRIEDQDPLYLSRLEQQLVNAQTEVTVAEDRLERARELRDNNLRIVDVTTEELLAMRTARDELVEAYDNFVDQSVNKLEAERNKLVAAQAKLAQAEADYKRKTALFNDGIESQLKQQEAEQKYRDAMAYVKVAEQEVENATNGVAGKKNEREAKRQEWQAKINKVLSQLEKSRAEVAKAEIDINKTNEEINQKRSKLLDQERKVAVQRTQEVVAPRDGYIMNLTVFDTASIVKPGDQLCRIVPRTEQPAVQVWVAGNDAPLITPGRKVRLQFEGWPAVQFSGWPSVAVGTFGGEVALVDATDDGMGKFRVVILPDPEDEPWPKYPYLRQGVRANGWVLLDKVPLGYEVWRRMNGFPPSLKSKEAAEKPKAPKIKI